MPPDLTMAVLITGVEGKTALSGWRFICIQKKWMHLYCVLRAQAHHDSQRAAATQKLVPSLCPLALPKQISA